MGKVVVVNNISLDGVMQAPGRPDEDTRDGFKFGGWGVHYIDHVAGQKMAELMARPSPRGALLFGRRTYQDFYAVWPTRKDGNPYTEHLNKAKKFVASRTLKEPLPWSNSELIRGDAADAVTDAVASLKKEWDLTVLGSGELVQSLMTRYLVDELVLIIVPAVFGSGRRMFPPGAPTFFQLVESLPTSTGAIIAIYRLTGSKLPGA